MLANYGRTGVPLYILFPPQGEPIILPELLTEDLLLDFINNYPDTNIICSHWGGGLPFYSLMPEITDSLKNVYFDTSASTLLYDKKIFDISVSLIGSKKILFGSDFPLVNPKFIKKHLDFLNHR